MKVGEDDPKIYPKHLDKLLGLEFALCVKYQPYYHHSFVLCVPVILLSSRKLSLIFSPMKFSQRSNNLMRFFVHVLFFFYIYN